MPLESRSYVNVAIIGAGSISGYHVSGLKAAGGARVAVLVGRDPDRTAKKASAFGIERAETDYRRVLSDRTIDAVVVATPDCSHEEIAIEALSAGKAVLLQKPMALTAAGCRNLLEAERRSESLLTVSFMHRYFPEVLWLRNLLERGSLGLIHSVRMRNATPGADWNDWVYLPASVAGGVVMQLGVHGIDLCQHLLGPIANVSAHLATKKPERVLSNGKAIRSRLEDTAFCIYGFKGGFMGSHEMSYTELAGCDRFRLELYSEGGSVWLRSGRGPAALYAPSLTGKKEWVMPTLRDEPFGAAHHRHWLSIVRREAKRDDTPEAGLSSIVIAESIYRAAHENRMIACIPGPPLTTEC